MSLSEQRELQRLRYRQGQLIRSGDFRNQQRIDGELTAWHNRGLHNAYGVAKGLLGNLKVEPLGDKTGVSVERGLAYDSFGRELLLLYKTSIPFADTQEPAFLVLSYQSGEQHDASCAAASLAWVPVKHFSSRDGVALAQTEINGGAVSLKPEFVQRQTRALARPRIASGTTIPGATIWENWDVSGWLEIVPGVQVRIDTSSAGFTTVPAYFASLQGGLTERNLNTISLHLDHIDEATPNGFVFRVAVMPFIRFPPEPLEPIPDLRKFFGERKAYVSWLAVESNTKPGETTAPA